MSVSRVPVLRLQHAQATVSWRNIGRLANDGLENISSPNDIITYRGRAILGHLNLTAGSKPRDDWMGRRDGRSEIHLDVRERTRGVDTGSETGQTGRKMADRRLLLLCDLRT